MQANLFFTLRTEYLLTAYEPLQKIAVSHTYLKEEKEYEWTFSVMNLKKVAAILGKEIVIPEPQLSAVSKYGEREKSVVTTSPYKGKGMFDVVERNPQTFLIQTVIRKKLMSYKVPTETIAIVWGVIMRYPLNKPVKTRTIAEHVVDILGVTRFHRHTGSFSFEHFFGSRRDYLTPLYLPLKVLVVDGSIIHTKTGEVIRIKDDWSSQIQLQPALSDK